MFNLEWPVFVLSKQDDTKGDGNKRDKALVCLPKQPGASSAETKPGMNLKLKKAK